MRVVVLGDINSVQFQLFVFLLQLGYTCQIGTISHIPISIQRIAGVCNVKKIFFCRVKQHTFYYICMDIDISRCCFLSSFCLLEVSFMISV